MDQKPVSVKPPRRYDSTRRRAQAQRTRAEILDAAETLLFAQGYAATTVAAIAASAGVSVETIYKGFGGKPGLVRAIWQRGLEGAGPIPAERRSDAMRSSETDPRRMIRSWGAFTSEVAPRVAPAILMIRSAAAADPAMAVLLAEIDEQRLRRMEENARTLYERGDLRDGISLEHARDVLWVCSAPALYELTVLKRGWSPEQHGEFVADTIIAALLPSSSGS